MAGKFKKVKEQMAWAVIVLVWKAAAYGKRQKANAVFFTGILDKNYNAFVAKESKKYIR